MPQQVVEGMEHAGGAATVVQAEGKTEIIVLVRLRASGRCLRSVASSTCLRPRCVAASGTRSWVRVSATD